MSLYPDVFITRRPHTSIVWQITLAAVLSLGILLAPASLLAEEGGETATPDRTPASVIINEIHYNPDIKTEHVEFIELYNPWSNAEPLPGEFCYDQRNGWQQGVKLDQVNPNGEPVWRLVIADDTIAGNPDDAKDPDDPDSAKQPNIVRSVYFVQPSGSLGSDGTQYYPNHGSGSVQIAPIKPGRYAVIGPGETTREQASLT